MNELSSCVLLSLKIAFIATILVMLFSTWLSWQLSEKPKPWCKILEFLTYLPMALPPVALGYGLLLIFGKTSLVGKFLSALGVDVAFTFLGAVVAAFFSSLGIGVRTMRVAFSAIEPAEKQVAYLHGASSWQIFYHIVFPQSQKAFFSGALLVFIRALGEFGATMVLVGNAINGQRTLAMAIWVDMEMPNKEIECLSLVLISVLLSLLALLAAEIWFKRA